MVGPRLTRLPRLERTRSPRPPDPNQRPRSATVAAILLSAILVAGALILPARAVQPAGTSLTLYGRAATGWSFAPGGETNPGPPISLHVGDLVTLHIIAEDGMPHALFVDLNDDGRIGGGDILSGGGTDVTYNFTVPDAPGSHYYYCSVHSGDLYGDFRPGAPMYGVFIVHGPPMATFAAPTPGLAWTGGVSHDLRFDMSDGEPPTSLTLWINYSANGGARTGPIAGPIPGTTNPNVVSWTPARFNATHVVVNVTARNSTGAVGYSLSAPFEIDSAAPTITGRTPTPNAVNVPRSGIVQVAWSEGMNRAASGAPDAFGVRRTSDGVWIAGTTSWSPDGTQMTFAPGSPWPAQTIFEVRVNATAKDDSTPGNPIATTDMWQFTTGLYSDTTPPTVASAAADPPAQSVGGTVTIRANVTDDFQVATVNAHVLGPGLDTNLTLVNAGGPAWSAGRTYTRQGAYTFTVWAIDTSGNANSGTGTFSISVTFPAPSTVTTAVETTDRTSVIVAWSAVIDPNVVGYHVFRSLIAGGPYTKLTTSAVPTTSPLRFVDTAVEAGRTYHYVVTAVDAEGNESPFSAESTIAIASPSTSIPPGYAVWVIAAIVAGGTLLAAAFFWLRRRRPGEPSK